MRTTPLPSILESMARNRGYRNENVRLYELAKIFRPSENPLPEEFIAFTLGAYGKMDFYEMKGAMEKIMATLRLPNIRFEPVEWMTAFHPGRAAIIYSGEYEVGVIGQIHPAVAKEYGLPETYLAELELRYVAAAQAPEAKFTQLPRFPAVERDLALVCDEELAVADLTATIKAAGGALLREVELFDIYRGATIAEGKKSTAFALKLRADDRTLTDDEADATVQKVLAIVAEKHNAVIR